MKASTLVIHEQVFRLGNKLVFLALMLIVVGVLFPYEFSFDGIGKANIYSDHFVIHVFLFLPLGFGLSCLTHKRGLGRIAESLVILIAGTSLSLVTEILQFALPTRGVSLSDGLANILGVMLGLLAFRLAGLELLSYAARLLQRVKGFLTIRGLIISFLGYAGITLLISIPLQPATGLTNWDDNYHLLVGNEHTGDRPWAGHVYHFEIANRVFSEKEVTEAFSKRKLIAATGEPPVCAYQLKGGGGYYDQSGRCPELIWKRQALTSAEADEAFLETTGWLETATPASFLSSEIRRTGQFTLSATVATAKTVQDGPARIISMSADPHLRNFTLGQRGSSLVFRLRTPLTGENGITPEFIASNVFTNTNSHHLVITYDGSSVLFYLEGKLSKVFELTPGATLAKHFHLLRSNDLVGYKALYYGGIFVTLGCLLGAILNRITKCSVVPTLLIMAGALLPSFILEGIFMLASGRLLCVGNIGLGVAMTAAGMALIRYLQRL